MILEKDIKALNGFSDKQHLFIQGFFSVFIVVELIISYNNLTLSIILGDAMGLGLDGILSMWNAEPELLKQYTGFEVQSLHRLNMAILNLGVGLVVFITLLSMSITRNRNKRILLALIECGAIQRDENA